jgi:WD40 repeat protein/tetratricopeptide (TPR) repeat protein
MAKKKKRAVRKQASRSQPKQVTSQPKSTTSDQSVTAAMHQPELAAADQSQLATTHLPMPAADQTKPPDIPLNPSLLRMMAFYTPPYTTLNVLALSADGQVLVTGHNTGDADHEMVGACDSTIVVWDITSGTEVHTLAGRIGSSVQSLAISADGQIVASSYQTISSEGRDSSIKVWDVPSGTEVRTLSGRVASGSSLALSADGQTLVSGYRDSTIVIWDMPSGTEVRTLSGYAASPAFFLALSADGQTLVGGYQDGTIVVWDVPGGIEARIIPSLVSSVSSLALSADGRTLAGGYRDGTIKIWDMAGGKEVQTLVWHEHEIEHIAISADGQTLVSAERKVGGDSQLIKVWNVPSGKELYTLPGHARWIEGIVISADGQTLVSGDYKQIIKVWDVLTGKLLRILEAFADVAAGNHRANEDLPLLPESTSHATLANGSGGETLSSEQGALLLLQRAGLLAPEDSLELASPGDRELALRITKALGGPALALDQAGAYVKETGCSLSEYQQLYQSRTDLFNERLGLMTNDLEPVVITCSLSFEQVQQQNPAAADLLWLCAILASENIPEEILTEGAGHLGPRLAPVAADTASQNQAIEVLRAYSLVDRDPSMRTFSMHRLVQVVLRDAMDASATKLWMERAVAAVGKALPRASSAQESVYEHYLPHALVCATWIEQEGMEFLEAARLLYEVGYYLTKHRRYAKAEPLYQRALSIYKLQLEPEDSRTVHCLNNLGMLYLRQGKYEQAEPLLQNTLVILEGQLGEHPDTAIILNNLASLYYDQGKYGQAEPLYQRVLSIREQQLGAMHPDTATSFSDLASLYYNQGKYGQAKPLYRRALSILEQQLGADYPDTLTVRKNYVSLMEILDEDLDYPSVSTSRENWDRFTDHAREVLRFANEEALSFGHNGIGTEHILIGFVRTRACVAAKVLSNLGIELSKVRNAVEFLIGQGDRIYLGEIGLTPRAKKVIELAADEARRLNHHEIGTEHLLLGLLREGEGLGIKVLESLGVNLDDVRSKTIQELSQSE